VPHDAQENTHQQGSINFLDQDPTRTFQDATHFPKELHWTGEMMDHVARDYNVNGPIFKRGVQRIDCLIDPGILLIVGENQLRRIQKELGEPGTGAKLNHSFPSF